MFAEDSLTMDTVYSGRVFQVEVHQVRLHDGSSARREIVRHSGGACVVALDEQNRVSMVRQYRKAFERELLELPAGKLEPGEAPLDCVRRELSEETGLSADHIELINTIFPSPGYCSETLYIYLATGLTSGDAHLDEGEHLSCECLPIVDLVDMIGRGEICDAKTVVGLLMTHKLLKERKNGANAAHDRKDGAVAAHDRMAGSADVDGET